MRNLLTDRTFRRFWTGQTVSLFGDQIALLAVPLTAVLVLHAGAAQRLPDRGRGTAQPAVLAPGRRPRASESEHPRAS